MFYIFLLHFFTAQLYYRAGRKFSIKRILSENGLILIVTLGSYLEQITKKL